MEKKKKEIYRSDGAHRPLHALKWDLNQKDIDHEYIRKEDIPTYPRPELHVSHVSHSTDLEGLRGISEDGGFKKPNYPPNYYPNYDPNYPPNYYPNYYPNYDDDDSPPEPKVVWFSLTPSPAELKAAEYRNMTLVHPGGREEIIRPSRVQLKDFATSPAFSSRSRYGSFRFTFSLRHVLKKYKDKFCRGDRPVLRVYRTVLYKQEVMYAVLVHRPIHWKKFKRFPLLKESSICAYRAKPEPHFVWRPQAMCGSHRDYDGNLFTQEYEQYYVWDHVALALHVGDGVLGFDDDELRESVRFCEEDAVTVPRNGQYITFQDFDEAEEEVTDLWPHHRYYYLQRFDNSYFHIQN